MILWLDALRLSLLTLVIGYAAYKDHKTGEVSNKVWLYTPIGLSLTLLQGILYPATFIFAFLSFIATLGIAITLFTLNGWGGADAKAFIMIGASLPITPFLKFNLFFMYPLNVILISSIIAFAAGKLLKTEHIRFLPFVFLAMFLAIAM